jgi:hypothetical protein
MLRWDWYGFHKKCVGSHYAELVFLNPVGSTGHVVHCGAFEVRNFDTLYFILEWDWCSFHKKRIGTSYVKLVCLHPVGYTGHVLRSRASGALFFMLVWDRYTIHKKRAGSCYAELGFCIRWNLRVTLCIPMPLGYEILMHYFSCLGGTSVDSTKNVMGYLTPNLYFCIRWDLRVT